MDVRTRWLLSFLFLWLIFCFSTTDVPRCIKRIGIYISREESTAKIFAEFFPTKSPIFLSSFDVSIFCCFELSNIEVKIRDSDCRYAHSMKSEKICGTRFSVRFCNEADNWGKNIDKIGRMFTWRMCTCTHTHELNRKFSKFYWEQLEFDTGTGEKKKGNE